jgi:hypothetical protein
MAAAGRAGERRVFRASTPVARCIMPTDMEAAILDFLRVNPRASFSDLARSVPGFSGEYAMGSSAFPSVILWRRVSEAAVRALWTLEHSGKVRFEPAGVEPYGADAAYVGLPVALRLEDFDTPHWFPVLVCARAVRKAARARRRAAE